MGSLPLAEWPFSSLIVRSPLPVGFMFNISDCYSFLFWDQGFVLLPLFPMIRSDILSTDSIGV